MLGGGHVLEGQPIALGHRGQGPFLRGVVVSLFVRRLFVDFGPPGHEIRPSVRPQAKPTRVNRRTHQAIHGIGHLARHEPLPDQPIQS